MYRFINIPDSDTIKILHLNYRQLKRNRKEKRKRKNNRLKNINVILYQTILDANVRNIIMSYL